MNKVFALLGNERSEDEILDWLHTEKLLLREAERLGIYISDQELSREINDLKSELKQDNDGYSNILAFCAGAEISEDEYWRISSPMYKEHWTMGILYKTLYDKFLVDNPDINVMEIQDLFDEYYKNYVNELKQKYDRENDKDSSSGEYSASDILRLLF